MSGKPNINTTACREAARYYVRETEKRKEPASRLIRDTIPGLCDEVDHLRAVVDRVSALVERWGDTDDDKIWPVEMYEDLRSALEGDE